VLLPKSKAPPYERNLDLIVVIFLYTFKEIEEVLFCDRKGVL
jgi:hypothetical protein